MGTFSAENATSAPPPVPMDCG